MSNEQPNRYGVLAFASTVAMGALAVWTILLPLIGMPVTSQWMPGVLAMFIAFTVAGRFPISYRRGTETELFTLTSLILAVSLATLHPFAIVAARILADGVVNVVDRRNPTKAVANISVALAETVMAVVCFSAVVAILGTDRIWIAVVASGLVADAVAFVLLAAAIGIYTRSTSKWFDSPASFGVMTASIDSALGALIIVVYNAEPAATLLLAAAPALVFIGYRNHARLSAEHRKLEMLAALTTTLAGVKDDRKLASSLIHSVVELTGSQRGWLIVESPGGLSTVRADHGTVARAAVDAAPTSFERAIHLAHTERDQGAAAALYVADDSPIGRQLTAEGHTCLLAASVNAGGLVATIAVADTVLANEWDAEDRTTFATLAAQAGAALRAGDLSDRLEREMAALATAESIDPLTELANRASFTAALDAAIKAGSQVAVLELDLDRFATVNGALGHRSGDLLLRAVAGRIRGAVRSNDIVARIGGDEFAVMVRDGSSADASLLAENVLARLASGPFVLAGISVTVGASVGIARSPGDAEDADGLLRCAHVALREAKLSPGSVRHFDAAPNRYTTRRLSLTTDLTRAVDRGDLDIHWQPQFDLRTGRIVGGEALARWHHSEHGSVSPGEFIPLAEEVGLIGTLTRRVVARAVRDLAEMADSGRDFRASINLSVHNLLEPDLPDAIAEILHTTGADPAKVRFEVTETAAMVDPTTTKTQLAALARLGTSISVDDFGTGYSSLAYLHDLHASEVKIDRVFTAGLRTDASAESIVRAIVGLAHELGLEVVAEGIEDAETAARLLGLGCDIGQGYHLARPMPRADFERLFVRDPLHLR